MEYYKLFKKLKEQIKKDLKVNTAFKFLVAAVIIQSLIFLYYPDTYKSIQILDAFTKLFEDASLAFASNKGPENMEEYKYAKLLDKDLIGKTKILFVNDQDSEGHEMLSYHMIQTYMDSEHLFVMEHESCPSNENIVNYMKKHNADYLVTFKNPYLKRNCAIERNKAGVYRLKGESLVQEKTYEIKKEKNKDEHN